MIYVEAALLRIGWRNSPELKKIKENKVLF